MIALAITGEPGVGKTTLLMRIIEFIKSEGIYVYGFYCPEVREMGRRIGFKIVNIATGAQGWLAIILEKAAELGYGVRYMKRLGKYVIIENEAERIGKESLMRQQEGVLAIDEIGPMELSIEGLRKAIIQALYEATNILVVLHRNMRDPDIINALNKKGVQIFRLTKLNRNKIYEEVLNNVRSEIAKTFKVRP